MAIVNAQEMLKKARKEGYAVPHINVMNLEWARAILEAAEEMRSPIIVALSEGAMKYMGGLELVRDIVINLHNYLNITVPVAIHLDHGTYELAHKALDAGFTSIMFDGSHYPFEENLAKTKELVAKAHKLGASIEVEVGTIGGEEDGVVGTGELADPNECRIMANTGIDMLAAGIGNIHGVYPDNWRGLDFDVLKEIQKATNNIPLVLHGGSGIPDTMLKKAISLGVSKINISTELQIVFARETRKYIEAGKDIKDKGFDPRKMLKPGSTAIKALIKEKIIFLGSQNRY